MHCLTLFFDYFNFKNIWVNLKIVDMAINVEYIGNRKTQFGLRKETKKEQDINN